MTARDGVVDERCRVRVLLGPAVDDAGRGVAPARRELEPAVGEHPLELVVEEEDRRERGRVVRLVEARVLHRDREVERRRHPAAARVQPLDALDRARRAQREPQAAVAREALLRREVVDVEGGRVDAHPARARRAVDDHERVAAVGPVHRDHHAGGRLVVRVRVHVADDAVGELRTQAGCGLAHLRIVEVGRGACDCGELRRELADHEVRAALLDEAERRRVPEQRGAAVADQHLVAVGKREQLREAAPDPADHAAHAVLAVARAEVAGRGVGERGDGLVGNLRRPGSEAAVERADGVGKLDVRCAHRITLAIVATDPGRVSGRARRSRRAARAVHTS